MAKRKQKTLVGWHFARWRRGTIILRGGRRVDIGERLRLPHPDQLEECKYGFHACRTLEQTINWAFVVVIGSHSKDTLAICRVRMSGRMIFGDHKLVASQRQILAALPVNRIPGLRFRRGWNYDPSVSPDHRLNPRDLERNVRRYLMEHGRGRRR